MLDRTTTRRDLLKKAGLVAGVGLAAMAIPACTKKEEAAPATTAASTDTGHEGMSAPSPNTLSPELIDQAHEQVVKAYPAKTMGTGMELLEPKIDEEWKVFDITVKQVEYEVEPGIKVPIWAYNGQYPGPLIRVKEGDKVRVNVTNEIEYSTTVHWHGLLLENAADGVGYITQDAIKKGETYTYEFTARNQGTHMYHSHHDAYTQIMWGMVGPLIVDPPEGPGRYNEDHDVIWILNDGHMGYTINGKRFPATQPIVAKLGERIRLRLINAGAMVHPFHSHGLTMEVVEMDGYPLPAPYKCDVLPLAPGQRYDVIIPADNPGVWAFHCHVLPHAESERGMHGMVSAIIVQE